jgi:predicted nuclease with RNAse H fold
VLVAGVDLAAEPKGTALAVIQWSPARSTLLDLQVGVSDEAIVTVAAEVEKIGIDCALGWPVEFIEFMNQQLSIEATDAPIDGGLDWRRRMAYRETDRQVRQITGRWPLSVSTDRLGMTAMRCSGLLSRMAHSGTSIDRSGAGKVVEVYPGSSLRLWGFATAGYRNSTDVRANLLAQLKQAAPWFDAGNFADLMVQSCDAFDAVIAAMATRSAALGRFQKPGADLIEQARIEGWIALPNGRLAALIEDKD